MPRKTVAHVSYKDPVSTMMAMLLPIHAAVTLDWLADATATAAERTLGAAFAFVYFERQDGTLERQRPASDLRRRSQQRAIDAFGKDALASRLDPASAPAIAGSLDSGTPVMSSAGDLFAGLIDATAAGQAQKEIGVDALSIVPLESAGERIGALLLMHVGAQEIEHIRLLADHVACATVNLRQSQAARESGLVDIVRSVFDARKLETDLQRELARAERYKRDVSIAIIEATNLRLLRDRFGTFLTDRLLQRMGGVLAQHSRDIDVIGAYRESGYTMILTEATAAGAAQAAGRLLNIARETAVDGDDVPGLELHLAAGWATAPTDGASTDALFSAAQRRMYGAVSEVA